MRADLQASATAVRQLVRQPARAAIAWGLAFGFVVYSSSATYLHAYPSALERSVLARSLGSNVGLAALFGPTRSLDTVGGFAAWRSLGLLTIVGAIWGLLTGTRMMRGEEEAGRWEILLAGAVTRRTAAIAGVSAGLLLLGELFALTSLGALAGGSTAHLRITSCLFLALVLVAPAAVFLGVGMLIGQLLDTRSSAARLASAVFGAAFLLRLVGVAAGIGWLRWLTPLGWVDATHPMTGSSAIPLLLVLALEVAVLGTVIALAGRRDLGAGVITRARARRPSMALLEGPSGLALRLSLPQALGWLAAIVTISSVLGFVSKSVGRTAAHSQMISNLVSRLGASHAGTVVFLGLAMLTVTSMIALAAAGAAAAVRETEAAGLADALLVTPVGRTTWLMGRGVTALAVAVLLGLTTGAVLSIATAGQHLGISVWSLLGAGLNAVPVAVVVIGLGVLIFALAPRLTAGVVYGLVAWSFLDELVGGAISAPNWVLDLSLLHHVALAPAADPRWGTNLILIGIGAAAMALGVRTFARRDLVLS